MGVSKIGGFPQNGWFIMVPTLLKNGMIWGGFPVFLETSTYQKKKNSEVSFPPMTSRWLCQSLPQNLQQLCGFIGRQLGQAIHLNTAFRIHTDLAPETKNLPGSYGSYKNRQRPSCDETEIHLLGKTTATLGAPTLPRAFTPGLCRPVRSMGRKRSMK